MPQHELLAADAHRDLRVRLDRGAGLGDGVMCCLTVPDEFRRVQNEYPILFRRDYERGSVSAFAMFGFTDGENLFLSDNRWDARYRPLAMEIQPFLIGQDAPGSPRKQVHVDAGSPRVSDDDGGVRVFDADGRATPFLEHIVEQLGALDAGYAASAAFFDALERHELLEPLSLDLTFADQSVNRLIGYHVIDEARLRALDASALGDLHRDGHLLPIFMALASLANIGALVERRNRRLAHG
ncbi:SapC family protein [Sphingomonas sp.]|uniref:SapC family protein n=1 Tax=Sphingomonas sp. TaxID=28214 RepID=UPI0035C8426D